MKNFCLTLFGARKFTLFYNLVHRGCSTTSAYGKFEIHMKWEVIEMNEREQLN
jgi:hypothetical protein